MKKIVAFLWVRSLAVAGVFAEVQFSGEILTGLYSEGAGLSIGEVDDARQGYRVQLNAGYEGENFGAKIRLQAGGNGADGWGIDGKLGFVGLPFAYVWFQPASWFKIVGGAIDGSAWATFGAYDSGFDDVNGIRFEFIPLEGLNLGVAYGVSSGEEFSWLDRLTVGAKYESDSISAVAGYSLGNLGGDLGFGHTIFYGVGYTFPFGLGLIVDGGIVISTGVFGVYIDEKITYNLLNDKLALVLVLKEAIATDEKLLGIEPEVSYAILDNLKAGVALTFAFIPGFDGSVKPYVEWGLGGATLKAYDKISFGDVGFVNGFGVSLKVEL
jgi:hypothetical protein